MRSLHTVLFNGYYIEFFIHYFTKNIIFNSLSRTINWMDIHIIDAAVNATVNISFSLNKLLRKTDRGLMSDNSGAMLIGVVILLFIILIEGIA